MQCNNIGPESFNTCALAELNYTRVKLIPSCVRHPHRHNAEDGFCNELCSGWVPGKSLMEDKIANEKGRTPVEPFHYLTPNSKEFIDTVKDILTPDEFKGYCKGNILKYIFRAERKNGKEDLEKAKKYIDFLKELI